MTESGTTPAPPEREPEWAEGRDAVHAWREYRPAKGKNAGRLLGSRALCGIRSAYMFDAVWSAPLSWPNAMQDAARVCHRPICDECRAAVRTLTEGEIDGEPNV